MIACEKAQELISCLVDNELSENDRLEVTEHIKTCPECKALYDAFSAVSENIGELEEAPDDLSEKVMRSVRAKIPEKRKTPWVKYLSVAACLALVIFAGTTLHFPKESDVTADCSEAEEEALEDAAGNSLYSAYDESQKNAVCDSFEAVNCITRSDDVSVPVSDEFISRLKTCKDCEQAAFEEDKLPDYTVTNVDGEEYDIFINGDTVTVSCGDSVYVSEVSAEEIENLFR